MNAGSALKVLLCTFDKNIPAMQQPPITLVNLSEAEKDKIAEVSQRNMVRGITLYIIPFLLFGALIWYVNLNYVQLGLEQRDTLREWINVGLVFLTILPARLFVNVILRHRKATNAWQKKVFRGKITSKDGKIITLVNQKIKLSEEEAARVKTGDDVILSISTTGEVILELEILNAQN